MNTWFLTIASFLLSFNIECTHAFGTTKVAKLLSGGTSYTTKRNPKYIVYAQSESLDSTPKPDQDCTKCNTSSTPTSFIPLQPFLPAYEPTYIVRGPVGQDMFIVSRYNGPTAEELSNENLFKVLTNECSDLEVNTLVWKCLGYRFDTEKQEWTNELVFPKWKMNFPSPPDLIGMKRVYSKEIDTPSLKANQQLVRSIPMEFKQSLKTHLRPLGFTGYKYEELTPNKTRRAQCVNWLLYFRTELFGYTVDELRERRRIKMDQQKTEDCNVQESTWVSPVREVFTE